RNAWSRAFFVTPTTSITLFLPPNFSVTWRPMGLRPAKKRFANASLITQTCGEEEVSCWAISRPRSSGIPTVEKYWGQTISKRENFSLSFAGVKPSTSISSTDSELLKSPLSEYVAPCTPGRERRRSVRSRQRLESLASL